SDQTIKTPEVRFDRRVSFFVWFLREAVQNMAALAGRSFHSWGVLSFINWFYGNAETKFPRIARAFTPMHDCNMDLGDKSRRVGSVGTGHACESKSIVVGRRLKKMQKTPRRLLRCG
ncbi:MAG: hypothetical protein DME50_15985, partial [Verrucomicrobia bacterium]